MIINCDFTHHYGSMKKRIPDQQSRLSLGAQTGTFVAPARRRGGRMSCFPSPVISRTRTAPCLIAGSSAPGGSVTTVTGGRLNRSRRLRMLIRWHRLSRWDSRSGGHHSERRARRHAQKIENGMKRAVMLFERAEYWEQRAQASLRHAKYKERPDVRYRRIKKNRGGITQVPKAHCPV
uniref:Uncharacterized protein n=1 Tax=Klebsiella pneumoniae TaxID=573 RepID=A0A2P1BPK7_KLEPN|nr:hypothetical protein [Klebsiella pneumoniae]